MSTPSASLLNFDIKRYTKLLRDLERHLHDQQMHPDYYDYYLSEKSRVAKVKGDTNPLKLVLKYSSKETGPTRLYPYLFARHRPVDLNTVFMPQLQGLKYRYAMLAAFAHAQKKLPGYQYTEVAYIYPTDDMPGNHRGSWVVGPDFSRAELRDGWLSLDGWNRQQVTKLGVTYSYREMTRCDPTGVRLFLLRPTPEGQEDGMVVTKEWPVFRRKGERRKPYGVLTLDTGKANSGRFEALRQRLDAGVESDWRLSDGSFSLLFRK